MLGSPTPSVVHLLTIFRQITAGELRIPAFQRDFVWRNNQIIDLLQSVRLGYPVGSILLWYVETPILKIASGPNNSFPHLAEKYPTSFILDGMQRLSSLYGVFHFEETTSDDRFDVWYDLDEDEFFHATDPISDNLDRSVPLVALFTPRKLLSYQGKFSEMRDGDVLIDKLVQLQAAFQDYMIPVVQIRGDDIQPIVNIFERVNSTGTTLGRVDFMRAITWAESFDLAHALDDAKVYLDEAGFSVSEETIIKCIALQLSIDPSGEALLSLRHKSPASLNKAFDEFRDHFGCVIRFAQTHLNIRSGDFIPYEGQLLVLFKAIGLGEVENDSQRNQLRRWFWATSFNESLRGKPDHYVTRAVNDWKSVVEGRVRGLEPRLKIAPVDFTERRLIKGKALSTAFICMFALNNSQSLTDHQMNLEPFFTLGEGETGGFHTVVPLIELRQHDLATGGSGKVFANMVIDFASGSVASETLQSRILHLAENGGMDVLRSQFIDESAVEALRSRNYPSFFWSRAVLMHQVATQMVS